MKLTIEISKKQLDLMVKALDFYSRILCGQLEEIPHVIQWADFSINRIKTSEDRVVLDNAISRAKHILFSEIAPASYSICAEGILPETAAIVYDIKQVIQNTLKEDTNIFKTSKKEILPVIKVEQENIDADT